MTELTTRGQETRDAILFSARQELLVSLDLFDVYRPGGPGEGRSLAFRLRLQASDRTLTDGDVASVRDKCVAAAAKLNAQLRG